MQAVPPSTAGADFARTLARQQAAASRPLSPPPTTEVAPTRTPLKGSEAADALSSAWQSVFHERPSKQTLAVLVGQWSLETGTGRSMWNHNFGGIKGTGPGGLTVAMRTKEGFGDTERSTTDRFRAYATPAQGATDYLALLARRFPQALDRARAGDATGFVHALKRGGYFTGSEETYTNAVRSIAHTALERGFDAVGTATWKSGDNTKSTPSMQSTPSTNDIPSLLGVQAVSFLQELDRAALRIAFGNSSSQDEPWWATKE